MGLKMLGTQKYTQKCPGQMPMNLSWLLKSLRVTNHQVFIKFQQNLLRQGGRTNRPDLCKIINSIWNKEKLPDGWKQSINVPIYKKDDKSL